VEHSVKIRLVPGKENLQAVRVLVATPAEESSLDDIRAEASNGHKE